MSVRRRHENSRWAMGCCCIWFRGLTSSLRGRPAAERTGNRQAMLAGGPLEAPVRPRRPKTSTRRTGSAEAAWAKGTETGGRDNSDLRRSASRRKQRTGFLGALRDTTNFARTPTRERPEKDCALRRGTTTNCFCVHRQRCVGTAKVRAHLDCVALRPRWQRARAAAKRPARRSRVRAAAQAMGKR